MEMTMETKPEPGTIAEEAVGQWLGSAPPDAVSEKAEMSLDETVRRLATSSGPQASISAKTAEAVGERVGDAYSDGPSITSRNLPLKKARPDGRQEGSEASGATNPVLATGRQVAQMVPYPSAEQTLVKVIAGFVLGYITAVLIRR
jgi:hypothetical protein